MPTSSSRPRYLLNLLLVLVLALLAAFYLILPVIDAWQALHPHRYPPGDANPGKLGWQYEDVTLTTSDGLKLQGWYIPSQNGAAIIAVHAYNGNRSGVLYHADLLARHGYGVLAFDLRAHGQSEGQLFPFGWNASPDVLAALAYLQARPEVDPQRIGALGLSIGAEIILQTAAQNHDLHAVVAEGAGWRSLAEWQLAPEPPGYILVPGYWVFYEAGALFGGVRPAPPLNEQIAQIAPTPLLLISAGDENRLASIYFAAAGEPKEHWVRPEKGHIDALFKHPQEYELRVIGLFDQALK